MVTMSQWRQTEQEVLTGLFDLKDSRLIGPGEVVQDAGAGCTGLLDHIPNAQHLKIMLFVKFGNYSLFSLRSKNCDCLSRFVLQFSYHH